MLRNLAHILKERFIWHGERGYDLNTCTLREIQHSPYHSVRILLLKSILYGWFPKISHRAKKQRGRVEHVIFGGRPLFCPTAPPRFREFWRSATVVSIRTNSSEFLETGRLCVQLKYVPIYFVFFLHLCNRIR